MDGNSAVFRKTTGRANSCDNQLVIIFPDFRVLRLFARSLFLTFAMLALPWLGHFQYLRTVPAIFPSGQNSGVAAVATEKASPEQLIPAVFQDLLDQGLFKVGEKAVFIGGSSEAAEIRMFIDGGAVPPLEFVDVNGKGRGFIVDGTVDFAFTANGFNSVLLIGPVLRVGGVAALRFSSATDSVSVPPNFKIVYLRHFHAPTSNTVIAIRKMNEGGDGGREAGMAESGNGLCPTSDAKRRAIRDLEDVLLEPPRESWVDSRGYLKRVKYLPDLMGEDLASFARHVYVEVSRRADGVGEWFMENYPARGRDFDIYVLEGDFDGGRYEPAVTWARKGGATGMVATSFSNWLKRNIREEEYVVVKMEVGKGDRWGGGGEFEVVREMVRSKAVCLIDELFLVCDHEDEGNGNRRGSRSMAYWECLALYGMLREEGVAVHQWWG
ncbi:uncharacterized protein LOC116259681 [Nymphaea colorata]|uniref:uncharacterized protein LOC116259681 n=1 Tax=Nymphaea colorata TaxID=210225 RepID=UPI00129E239B|nr:uncharacterized protein LOC116259681 [Nymphaea colorata]